MTNPEADFGDALRRALAGAADVTPVDGEALRHIRARASVRTPRRRLQAALAIVIPWPAFRLFQYRTMVMDLLRRWLALASDRLKSARDWLEARAWPAVRAALTTGGQYAASGREWFATRVSPAVARARVQAAAVTRRWISRPSRSTHEAQGAQDAQGAHAPRHADPAPPPSRVGWMRPALAAAAVAFVATLALTIGPVRQAFVQLGSSVISVGHTQGGGGKGGGSLSGTGGHLTPAATPSPSASKTTSTPRRPSVKPSVSPRSSCGASPSAVATTAACATTSATPAPSATATVSPTASASSTPTASPSASPSVSPSPTATDTDQVVTGPSDEATSTPLIACPQPGFWHRTRCGTGWTQGRYAGSGRRGRDPQG
jgi:hypothetical protein